MQLYKERHERVPLRQFLLLCIHPIQTQVMGPCATVGTEVDKGAHIHSLDGYLLLIHLFIHYYLHCDWHAYTSSAALVYHRTHGHWNHTNGLIPGM